MRTSDRRVTNRRAKANTEPRCIRCGHPVPDRPHGCKGPCPNCGFLYPLGDCSD